ncbi:ATP-dependent endonuclease [Mitsuaria sp. 7]|uniref:ATP-dependent nuclease n=1 Tax=Mitsuaria sp. 7 TaxID=1658665 RepID=UPI0008325821|nr:TOPRIM nucleotidyl transferase/hydrolase domain-containing protein [Mitsuaria sp. 7]
MRLAGFHVENFKSIGPSGCLIRIDEIVVLIGRNKVGLSTILDAYEALASGGKALSLSHFHNQDPGVPIAITGYFDQVSTGDEARIGQGWQFDHPDFGACVAFRYVWRAQDDQARLQAFDPDSDDFVEGAPGMPDGFHSIVTGRIPQPVRIRPTDPKDTTRTRLLTMRQDHLKQHLMANESQTLAALLWSTLSMMCVSEEKTETAKKTDADVGSPRILLIDEPEAFLHPPTIRGARETLYDFAVQNPHWRVIATTRSPFFIDLTKDHTTLIRIGDAPGECHHVLSTDRVAFDERERERLRMIRACNPLVNEFFFHDDIVLVDGVTEQIAMLHMARNMGRAVHVINCLGKANLPMFARLLNDFQVPYTVIHDADTRFVKRAHGYRRNGLWATNDHIRATVEAGGIGRIHTQFPHFEGECFGETMKSGKVDRVLRALEDPDSEDFRRIVEAYAPIINRDPSGSTTTRAAFDRKLDAYLTHRVSLGDPLWYQLHLPPADQGVDD